MRAHPASHDDWFGVTQEHQRLDDLADLHADRGRGLHRCAGGVWEHAHRNIEAALVRGLLVAGGGAVQRPVVVHARRRYRAARPRRHAPIAYPAPIGAFYAFGHEQPIEGDRLSAVERSLDPPTRSILRELGVAPGWRCWEIGAGRGSMATWLAEAVRPAGRVLATDISDQWFSRSSAKVEFRVHDISRDPLPSGGFDLIHARLVFEHLDDPAAVIRRLIGALVPGGILVAQDRAGLRFGARPFNPSLAALTAPWERAGQAVGWDASYGLRLAEDLLAAGLSDVGGREYRVISHGGPAWEHASSGLRRLENELDEQGVSARDMQAALGCLQSPSHLITGPPMMMAWGARKPHLRVSR